MASKNFKILIQKPNSYAVVDNLVLRHKSMSLQAKGLYAILCGFSDEMIVSFDYLQNMSSNGRDALRKAFVELESFKCIKRTRKNGDGGQFTMITELLPVSASTLPANLPLTEKPSTVKPSVDFPPSAEKPPTVNQAIKKTNLEEEIKRDFKKENSLKPLSKSLSYFEFVDFIREHSHFNGRPIEFTVSNTQSVFVNSRQRLADWQTNDELNRKDAETAFKSLFKRKAELVPALEANFAKEAQKNAI